MYTTLIEQQMRTTQMTKFNTRAEAKAAGAALYAAGKCTAWTDYSHFGKFILRIQVGGKHWFNLTSSVS